MGFMDNKSSIGTKRMSERESIDRGNASHVNAVPDLGRQAGALSRKVLVGGR